MTDYERIEKAIGYINRNFREQPDLDKMAKQVYLSPFHFQRLFKEWAGVSPKKFLQYISLEHAKQLLQQKHSLADTSFETTKLHTTAHLMLAGLRKALGDHVSQKGSNITAERLRFDFSHKDKMTSEQIKGVEDFVNKAIKECLPGKFEEMTLEQAKEIGATGVFESKYGEKVKVYTIGDVSKEICGGPHINNTSELGKFKIVKEESSSAGVRRIKAILE